MRNILLGLTLILMMLSLNGCLGVVHLLNTTDKTLQEFDLLLQNSASEYRWLQENLDYEQIKQDSLKKR